MEQLLEMITTYGLETVIIAVFINILTAFVKIPIKLLANKLNDYTKVTKYIVFLPIVFGFLLSFLYAKFIVGVFNFDRSFITMWLTSSSLSLTFYAIFEKLFPSKKKLLSDCEIKTNETILTNIRQLVEQFLPRQDVEETSNETDTEIEEPVAEDVKDNKIILRGKVNAEVNVEK